MARVPLNRERSAIVMRWLDLSDAEWERIPQTARRKLWRALQQQVQPTFVGTPKRRCKGCGKPEQKGLGYTTVAPQLGYCVECINRALPRQEAA